MSRRPRSAGWRGRGDCGRDRGLAGIRLVPAALRLAPEELAEEILACAKGAQAKLADRVGEAMAGVLGAESTTSQYVSQAYAERFGSAAEAEPKP